MLNKLTAEEFLNWTYEEALCWATSGELQTDLTIAINEYYELEGNLFLVRPGSVQLCGTTAVLFEEHA